MNKLIIAALLTKFDQETVNGMLPVLEATNNSEVAAEMLLGLYEEPEIPSTPVKLSNFSVRKVEIAFLNFNPFKQEIKFQHKECETISGWFKKGIDTDLPSTTEYSREDAAKVLGLTPKEVDQQYIYRTVPLEDTVKKDADGKEILYTDTCSLASWLGTGR